MKSLRLYYKLPYWAKCLTASWYGRQLKKWRFGEIYNREFKLAEERENWSLQKLQAYQAEELSRILRIALVHVPWYREHISIEPARITPDNAFDILTEFPVLEKEQIRSEPERFLNDRYSKNDLYEEHTSGTTGTPLRLWWSREMVQKWYAMFHLRWLGWAGITKLDRWAIFGGQLVAEATRESPPFWVRNYAMNQCYFSAYHLAPNTVEAYLDELSRFKPRYILGYASTIESLVSLAKDAELSWSGSPIDVVFSNAEPFFNWQRERIESFFGVRSVDTYGASEGVFMGVECDHRKIHLCPDVGVWEVLDRNGISVLDGVVGEFVCTGLLNEAMPLIRYRTGDCVALSVRQCACSRSFPTIERIEGRSDDMIILPDGRRIGRMDPIFKAEFPIREAQITQIDMDHIKVLVVPAIGFNNETTKEIQKAVSNRLGEHINVEITTIERIPRTKSGKFRTVISLLSCHER